MCPFQPLEGAPWWPECPPLLNIAVEPFPSCIVHVSSCLLCLWLALFPFSLHFGDSGALFHFQVFKILPWMLLHCFPARPGLKILFWQTILLPLVFTGTFCLPPSSRIWRHRIFVAPPCAHLFQNPKVPASGHVWVSCMGGFGEGGNPGLLGR